MLTKEEVEKSAEVECENDEQKLWKNKSSVNYRTTYEKLMQCDLHDAEGNAGNVLVNAKMQLKLSIAGVHASAAHKTLDARVIACALMICVSIRERSCESRQFHAHFLAEFSALPRDLLC